MPLLFAAGACCAAAGVEAGFAVGEVADAVASGGLRGRSRGRCWCGSRSTLGGLIGSVGNRFLLRLGGGVSLISRCALGLVPTGEADNQIAAHQQRGTAKLKTRSSNYDSPSAVPFTSNIEQSGSSGCGERGAKNVATDDFVSPRVVPVEFAHDERLLWLSQGRIRPVGLGWLARENGWPSRRKVGLGQTPRPRQGRDGQDRG